MKKKVISTQRAPQAIGPYSQAVRMGSWLFVSGQIPLDPLTGELIPGDVQAQTKRVMENIKAIVEDAGGSLAAISKCTIYLTNLDNFGLMNETYGSYFKSDPPARATVEVSKLPKGVDVEIDAIAYLGN